MERVVHLRVVKHETVKQLGLDVARHHTCAQPVKGQVAGCPFWRRCTIKERMSNPNPRVVGCAVIVAEQTGQRDADGEPIVKKKLVNMVMDCFHVPDTKRYHELNGGALLIKAHEGEKFPMMVTKRKHRGEGADRVSYNDDEVDKDFVVPAFKEQGDLLGAELASATFDVAMDEREDERTQKAVQSVRASTR